ncbi:MAG: PAS domain-containing protein [Rickettsiales bacterium]
MPPTLALMRFSDEDFNTPSLIEFMPRERGKQIWRIIIAFAVVTTLIILINFSPKTMGGNGITSLITILAAASLCFYVVLRKQQSLDLVMMTEFQNMLFAQAAALGSNFCMFVKRDGTIEYANDGVKNLLPHYSNGEAHALEALLYQSNVNKTDVERLMGAIISGQRDRLIFPIVTNDNKVHEYILTVEPLTRPAGYTVVRGREYRDHRAGSVVMPEVLRSTSAEKVDHLLTHSGIPHYIVNEYGKFEYVNPVFEQALGYRAGEVLDSRLSFYHVIYQLKGQPVTEDFKLSDMLEQATLQQKNGALVPAAIKQTTIRDESGKVIGATGSIVLGAAS